MSKFTQKFKGDKTIWLVALALALTSILAVYSSTYNLSMNKNVSFYYLSTQVMVMFVGFIFMYLIHKIPVQIYCKFALAGFIVSMILLISMFFYGGSNVRAMRWSWLPIVGEYQPSDIVKILMVIYLAKMLDEANFKSFGDFFLKILAPVGLVCIIILKGHQSAVIIMGFVYTLMILISGIKISHKLITLGLVVSFGIFYICFGDQVPWFNRHSTLKGRTKSERVETIQEYRAKVAVASGKLFGKGPGNSTQRKYLSEGHNDFIYSIIIEEYGLAGGIMLMLLYLILFYRVILLAKQCARQYTMLLLTGLICLLMIQATVHMGVASGAITITGQTLPLISMGGTSALTACVALGMILSVSRAVQKNEAETESKSEDCEK
ncbi:MAG: FtsW/RodA/SpoVE family cell cycle protein [Prevotellaceae bacterium]|jgi:cell division protein FtsW|nr:FtsW/RodA/SpoVE family cell cycle protein [Prevotellaceae bacterium]